MSKRSHDELDSMKVQLRNAEGCAANLRKELEAARAEAETARVEIERLAFNSASAKAAKELYRSQLQQALEQNEAMRSVLGDVLLQHDRACILVTTKEKPLGEWACAPDCMDLRIRAALSAPPLPASRVKRLEEALRFYADGFAIMDYISGTYEIKEEWYSRAREALDAEASLSSDSPLDAGEKSDV